MPIRDIVDAAVAKGLSGGALTDHYDFEIPEGVKSFTFDPQEQAREIEKTILELPVEVASSFKILRGVEVGMQDPYHFSKQFKNIVGISPSAFMKQAAKPDATIRKNVKK